MANHNDNLLPGETGAQRQALIDQEVEALNRLLRQVGSKRRRIARLREWQGEAVAWEHVKGEEDDRCSTT